MSDPVSKLVLELSKLPGIGEKTAVRLAYHVLKTDESDVRALSEALLAAKVKIRLCEECFTFTDISPCAICSDTKRNPNVICVVEKPADVMAIENSQKYLGRYHVLHGVLSPLDGVGPDQIRIRELLRRTQSGSVTEIILAINPTVEGEATGVYLTKLLRPLGGSESLSVNIRISKIAHGIPVGGVLEYIDRQTIGRAIENRVASA